MELGLQLVDLTLVIVADAHYFLFDVLDDLLQDGCLDPDLL